MGECSIHIKEEVQDDCLDSEDEISGRIKLENLSGIGIEDEVLMALDGVKTEENPEIFEVGKNVIYIKEEVHMDDFEESIEEHRVNESEEYMIKNEESNSNSFNLNRPSTKEAPRILNSLMNNSELTQWNLYEHHGSNKIVDKKNPCSKNAYMNSVNLNIGEPKYLSCGNITSRKHILDIKKYKCQLCEYATNKRYLLRNHVDATHLNIKKYKCGLCGYAASHKQSLNLHVKSAHLNIKEHKCHLCDYATNKKNHLEIHVTSVHLKIVEQKCRLCDYETSLKSSLQRHINNVHLNIKKHKCHLCEYRAPQKSSLDKHFDSYHLNIGKNECELCEFVGSRKDILQRHMESVH